MQGIKVRSESTDDLRAIDVVNLSAFEGEQEAKLVAELRKLPDYSADFSLVAEFNGRLVGHLMLTPGQLIYNGEKTPVLLLAPMSVVPSQSHRGIGTELVDAAIKLGKEKGFAAIITAGQPDYYARLGFEPSAKRDIHCNLPVPEDAIMMVELDASAISQGGMVNYSAPFLSLY